MSDQKDEEKQARHDEAAKTEYKNDNVTVQVQRFTGCRVKFDIIVTPKASMAAYKKAVKSINKEVSLPGFRKGKAPEAMIVQNYGSYVDQEWKEVVVQTAFKEAMELTELYPLNEDSIKKPQIKITDKEKDAEIAIEFESSPQIPDISPGDLKLKQVERKTVTEEQIEESLENIRLHHADWEDVKDRGIEEGDYVDVDIQDNDNPERYICKDTRFEVVEGKMGDWMRRLVAGKNVNDTVVGMSERSPNMDPSAEFKPTNCKITIKAVKKAVLPPIDEELAKKVGVQSVKELEERVLASLNSQADEEVQQQLRDQMENALLEKYSFEVPDSLIQREIKNRLDFMRREMGKAGKTSEEISQALEQSQAKVEEDVKRAFQIFFISRKIADKHHIHVTQDELVRELMLQMYSQSSALDSSLDPDEARSKVYVSILSQKVKDFLISQAAIE